MRTEDKGGLADGRLQLAVTPVQVPCSTEVADLTFTGYIGATETD